jgi:hypothetical protein
LLRLLRMLIKFCFEIEYFDDNAYYFKVNIPQNIRLVSMTRNSSLNDIGLFIGSLLDFNDLSLNSEFIDALFKEEELGLVGGLLFESNDVVIGASCCADFQDWVNVVQDIKRKCSPWMGHNPTPWFEFENEWVTLWSDKETLKNCDFIQFTQQEFDEKLLKAKEELNYFIEIVEEWAKENYFNDYNSLVAGINYYLGVTKIY